MGSTIRYSGAMEFAIVRMFKAKSVLPLQQIHFSVSSHTLSPDSSFRISSSTLSEAYSFSRITKSRFNISDIALINVVFPAPRKPEIISTFIKCNPFHNSSVLNKLKLRPQGKCPKTSIRAGEFSSICRY